MIGLISLGAFVILMALLAAWPPVSAVLSASLWAATMFSIYVCYDERRLTSDAYIGAKEDQYIAMRAAPANQGPQREPWWEA